MSFQDNVEQIWGQAGLTWLKQIPGITAALAQQWNLSDLVPAHNLSYNYIALGHQRGRPIALKIGFDENALRQEKNALQAYGGTGSVQLIEHDVQHYKALLIERAEPGSSLGALFPEHDDQAVAHAVTVMQQLHTVPISTDITFPSIQDWLQGLEEPHTALTDHYHIHKARGMARELVATQATPVLLHGDLHHNNILAHGTGWLAIDPKGVVGEPAYEVGAFVRNPFPELLQQKNPGQIMQQRLIVFSRLLAIDLPRLQQWSYVQAVLAGCWGMQDGQTDAEMAMAEATLLDAIIQQQN